MELSAQVGVRTRVEVRTQVELSAQVGLKTQVELSTQVGVSALPVVRWYLEGVAWRPTPALS